ncbi:MAG: aldolase/citrate lyase family protein [Leifsonia sp.]
MSSSSARADRRSQRESTRIGVGDARSWLLLSAMNAGRFDEAQLSCADQVVFDLEDGVDDSRKPIARANVVDWLLGGGNAWVRINDWSSPHWSTDLEALGRIPSLVGVMLAKTEAPEQVTDTFQRLGGEIPVVPLVETAVGIENAGAIASARGAARLAFGSGDYRRDTGVENTELAMAYPRTRLVVASRIGRLPGPIDGPTVSTTHGVLRDQSSSGVAMGMTGKLCVDFEQLDVVNESLSDRTVVRK